MQSEYHNPSNKEQDAPIQEYQEDTGIPGVNELVIQSQQITM